MPRKRECVNRRRLNHFWIVRGWKRQSTRKKWINESKTISSQPSSEFLKLLKPEVEDPTSTGQKSVEAICLETGKVYSKPFQNKMLIEIDRPLGPEPRVKIQMPKPEPRGEEFFEDYTSPLDGPSRLDKYYKNKNFGFYGKGLRSTHAQSFNFFNYRKANTVGHPNARFEIDENDFF